MASAHSTVGSILRATQAFCQQLCDKQTLDHGIAFYSDRFAGLPEANQFREIVLPDSSTVADAFRESEAWFRDHGLTCLRWAPAAGMKSDDWGDFLASHGFAQRTFTAMLLTDRVELQPPPDVRILHARAVRAAFRETVLQPPRARGTTPPQTSGAREWMADACEARLDDPQFDMFVALVEKRAAGRAALYQVGDFARIMDFVVLDDFAGRGVERALLDHVLALARRLAMRSVVVQVSDAEPERCELFQAGGFTADGRITEFHRFA